MDRTRSLVSTIGLVGSPLLLLAYFVTYPAYGEVHGADIARAVSADPGLTRTSDVLALAGCFLAVPATLAFMRVLRPGSPKLATIGGGLALLGWVALVGALMTDVVAIEVGEHAALFDGYYSNPIVVGLNALAGLHIVGAVLIGVALVRTRLVPIPLAAAATVAPVVHLASNLNGLLWLDAITWLVLAATGAVVAQGLMHDTTVVSERSPHPAMRNP